MDVVFRTVLFYQVVIHDEHFLFLKPEDNGLGTWPGLAKHSVDYAHSRMFGNKDDGVERKERVDKRIQQHFEQLRNRLAMDSKDTASAKNAGPQHHSYQSRGVSHCLCTLHPVPTFAFSLQLDYLSLSLSRCCMDVAKAGGLPRRQARATRYR